MYGKYYANDGLDIILKDYLNYKDGFVYRILVANDGVRQSNTLYLEKFNNWRGILIEPSFRFKNLIKNRNKKNYFFNVACSSFEDKNKQKKLYYADMYTVSKEYAVSNFKNFNEQVQRCNIM